MRNKVKWGFLLGTTLLKGQRSVLFDFINYTCCHVLFFSFSFLCVCVCVFICVSRYMFSCLHTLLLGIRMRERTKNKTTLYFNGCMLINKSPTVMCLATKEISAVTLDVPEKASDHNGGTVSVVFRVVLIRACRLLFPGWHQILQQTWPSHASMKGTRCSTSMAVMSRSIHMNR